MTASFDTTVSTGQKRSAVHHLTEFDQVVAFFAGWNGRLEQLSAGRLSGNLSVVRGRAVRIVALECNQSILARGQQSAGMFGLYPVSPSSAGGIWQGRRLDPGSLVVHGPDATTDHRTARHLGIVGFTAPMNLIADAARTLSDDDDVKLPGTWSAIAPSPRAFQAIGWRFQRLLDFGRTDHTSLGTAESDQLEQDCIRAVVAGVVADNSMRRKLLAQPVRAQVVSRADDHMRSRLREPLGVVDLCAELRVSDRTLRLAFRERFGVGPMTYYRFIRLNAVRAALKSDPEATVATVARDHGFQHLGNFAADYRRLFGERPSDTRASCSRPFTPFGNAAPRNSLTQ